MNAENLGTKEGGHRDYFKAPQEHSHLKQVQLFHPEITILNMLTVTAS